jgi:hypothetical protein
MRRAWVLAGALALAAACGGKKAPAVAAAERLADAMCKCQKNSCFEEVMAKHKADVELVEKALDDKSLPEADRKGVEAAAARAEKCAKASSGF